jgi:hypothetical protein
LLRQSELCLTYTAAWKWLKIEEMWLGLRNASGIECWFKERQFTVSSNQKHRQSTGCIRIHVFLWHQTPMRLSNTIFLRGNHWKWLRNRRMVACWTSTGPVKIWFKFWSIRKLLLAQVLWNPCIFLYQNSFGQKRIEIRSIDVEDFIVPLVSNEFLCIHMKRRLWPHNPLSNIISPITKSISKFNHYPINYPLSIHLPFPYRTVLTSDLSTEKQFILKVILLNQLLHWLCYSFKFFLSSSPYSHSKQMQFGLVTFLLCGVGCL